MKWLLKKKITANVEEHVVFSDEILENIGALLIENDKSARFNFAASVSSLGHDTASKYKISLRSAIYGDGLTWRQLSEAVDDWNAAGEAASRLSQSDISPKVQLYGFYTAHSILLYMSIYQMRFDQQQFPDVLGEDVSRIFHVSTDIAQICCDLVSRDKTDMQFLKLLKKYFPDKF